MKDIQGRVISIRAYTDSVSTGPGCLSGHCVYACAVTSLRREIQTRAKQIAKEALYSIPQKEFVFLERK